MDRPTLSVVIIVWCVRRGSSGADRAGIPQVRAGPADGLFRGASSRGGRGMRRFRIGLRVVMIAGVGVLVALVLLVTAVGGFQTQLRAGQAAQESMRLNTLVMEAKFRIADIAGWQTGYAFDFNRGVPDATSDTVGQRKEFLASAAALRDDYARIAEADLVADQSALLSQAREAFESFMRIDAKIVAGYRDGSAAAVRAANDLASGDSLAEFGKASQATADLAAKVSDDGIRTTRAAASAARGGRQVMIVAGVVGLLVSILFAYVVTRSIIRPLSELRTRLNEIADGDGDLRARLAEDGGDELTHVARTFNRFVGGIAGTLQAVDERSNRLADRSRELTAVSGSLAASADETSRRAATVSGSADLISSNVQTVAAGAEQMGSSIGEIARSAGEAARVAADATTVSATVTETVGKLGDSSRQIGEIAKVISAIAEQTNLLALNATIEAARAGEQGKGFAVVAGEVKELASETARATADIDERIRVIQADTGDAVEAIARITEVIGRINDLQTTIASAIEEQTATTGEMSRSIGDVASGASGISADVTAVADTARVTTGGVTSVRDAASELAGVSAELRGLVERFRF
jgi:methyl-accepting chemotaxis protein